MFHSKKLNQWYSRHEKKINSVVVVMLVLVDISLIVGFISQTESANLLVILTRIMAAISTAIWIMIGVLTLKSKILERFFTQVFADADKLYFHGFKLTRFLDSDAILRLENWLGVGACYELSALAMILLKNQKTARICRGESCDLNGNFITKHSWAEVRVPFNGWYVVDFAWITPVFCKRRAYFQHQKNNTLTKKWTCSYDDFWKVPFASAVYKAMQKRTTSCVLLELSGFGSPINGYGFLDWVYETKELRFSHGNTMIPHYRSDTSKPVSSRIIRDFVKNPRRLQPKAKSIRLAQQGIRKFNAWVAQQSAT